MHDQDSSKPRQITPVLFVFALVVILGGLIFGVPYYQNSQQELRDKSAVFLNPLPCDLSTGDCVALRGDISMRLSITPQPLASLQALTARLTLEGIQAEEALLELEGVDMYMGLNQTRLDTIPSSRHWQGETELAVCTTGSMRWRARVTFLADGQIYTSHFEFDAQ